MVGHNYLGIHFRNRQKDKYVTCTAKEREQTSLAKIRRTAGSLRNESKIHI